MLTRPASAADALSLIFVDGVAAALHLDLAGVEDSPLPVVANDCVVGVLSTVARFADASDSVRSEVVRRVRLLLAHLLLSGQLLGAHFVVVELLGHSDVRGGPLLVLRKLSWPAGELASGLRVEVDARVVHLTRLLHRALPLLLRLARGGEIASV